MTAAGTADGPEPAPATDSAAAQPHPLPRDGGCSVWAVVLNWNRRDDTLACLASLAAMRAPGVRLTVLMVDNGSTDGSLAAVNRQFPDVRCLGLPTNLGYARGINAGVAVALEAGADWTFLVNNDAVVAPDTLAELLAGVASAPTAAGLPAIGRPRVAAPADVARPIGIATPTIFFFDRPEQVWPSAGWRRRLTLAAFDTTASPPTRAPYPVAWATGCGLLVRRAVWAEVGLLDPAYFMYYEDHDFCLRAVSAGWRIVHVPSARMWHKVSASSGGVGSPAQSYALARSSVRFFWQHTRGWHRAFILVYRLGSLTRTLFKAARAGNLAAARAYVRGLRDGWRALRGGRADDFGGTS